MPPLIRLVASIRARIDDARIKVPQALWRLLLNDKVRPFIWVYYLPLWLWGLCGTFFAWPTSYVFPVMGHTVYDLWIWACLAATSVCMAGLWMEGENSGQDHERAVSWRDKIAYIGIGWQTGGHACMFGVLLAFQISAIHEIPWGSGATFSIFIVTPYVIGCLLLTAQGMVKLFATEALTSALSVDTGAPE